MKENLVKNLDLGEIADILGESTYKADVVKFATEWFSVDNENEETKELLNYLAWQEDFFYKYLYERGSVEFWDNCEEWIKEEEYTLLSAALDEPEENFTDYLPVKERYKVIIK